MPRRVDDSYAALGRRCWGGLEPLHVLVYFAPEPREAYGRLGVEGRAGYFASRAAALGPVAAAPVVSAFYVFAPRVVAAALPDVWRQATPATMTTARRDGVGAALHRALGEPDVAEALDLVRAACEGLSPGGRPMYAAHSTLSWPDEPLLQLWHAATLIREHRGDGHVNALVHAGVEPLEAMVLSGTSIGNTEFLERTRGWTDDEWASTRERLRTEGLVAGGDGALSLTRAGSELVAALEAQTDGAAAEGWIHLGPDRCERLLALVRPLREAVLTAPEMPAWLGSRG